MRIGILYNLSDRMRIGRGVEHTADEDIPNTVRAVKAVFEKRHVVVPIKFSPDIYSYLDRGNIDVLFNMCEGFRDDNLGEAYITALFERLRVPFTGSNFFTLALCMDKVRAKEILRYHGLPTPDFQVIRNPAETGKIQLPLPVIVKPLYEDASIGIYQNSVVRDPDSLRGRTLQLLGEYKQPALIEEYIDGRELNVSLMGNDDSLTVFPAAEIDFRLPEFFERIVCYNAKWVKDSIPYNNTPTICPANLAPELLSQVEELSRKAFTVTGCRDYARVDMRLREEQPYIIEVNPNPGKYIDCGFVKSAMAAGLSYEDLCYKIVETAMLRCGMDTGELYREPRFGAASRPSVPGKNRETGSAEKEAASGEPGPEDISIETERLYGRPVRIDQLSLILDWFNDPEIARFMENPEYIYTEQELYEMFLISKVHELDLIFLLKTDGTPIGYGSVYNADYKIGTGEISFLLGRKSLSGRGFGTEMAEALVSACFTRFGLSSIFASAVIENKASIRALKNAGFREIGIRRKSHLLKGNYYDEIYFDITAD